MVCRWCAGKTTLLRDIVSKLANSLDRRVVVVDTWNEVGGDAAVPHACLRKAHRISVHDHSKQHEVMLQAVQDHNPEVPSSLPIDTTKSAAILYQAYAGSSACLLCCCIMQPITAVLGLSVYCLSGASGCRHHMVFTLKS